MSDDASDRFRERSETDSRTLWVVLEADRLLVTAGLGVGLFAVLVLAGSTLPGAVASLASGDSVDTLFQATLAATITGVTLVVTLNQLVLSQELGPVGAQRERMDEAIAFRERVAEVIGAPVAPTRPAQLLRALVVVAGRRAADVEAAVGSTHEASDDARRLADEITATADEVGASLDDAQFGRFEVVSAALNVDYSRLLFLARRLRASHAFDETAAESLDELVETLQLFGPAREHVKTLYFQWELITLSQAILTAAVPALAVSAGAVAFLDPAQLAGPALIVVVSLATTVAVTPFLLLLAYILRIATVAQRTLSIGPFILRATDELDPVEWEKTQR